MSALAGDFLEAAVRTATPLALAALGEAVTERSGVINIGLEGAIIGGAFGAFAGATSIGIGGGFVAGALAGAVTGCVFALFVVGFRANQIITGTAVTLLGLGLTGLLYRASIGVEGVPGMLPTTGTLAIPGLARIPLLGDALFAQAPPTYLVYLLVPALGWWLFRTHAGLALRAVGERPEAAVAAGISPPRVRFAAIVAGSTLGGLAGATLVLAQAGTFAEGMSAGRGFIAIAVVALGRWHPGGVALAALLFGAASAVQYVVQTAGWEVPYQLVLAIPYVLTLVVLAGAAGRSAAPAALGREDDPERAGA